MLPFFITSPPLLANAGASPQTRRHLPTRPSTFACAKQPNPQSRKSASLFAWLKAAAKLSGHEKTIGFPDREEGENRNEGKEKEGDVGNPTVSGLMAALHHDEEDIFEAGSLSVAIREAVSSVLQLMMKKSFEIGRVVEDLVEDVAEDVLESEKDNGDISDQSREVVRDENEEGEDMGNADGLDTAICKLLEAVSKRRKEWGKDSGEVNDEDRDGERASSENAKSDEPYRIPDEEASRTDGKNSDEERASPLAWMVDFLSTKIPAELPVDQSDLLNGVKLLPKEILPSISTEEAESQLVSWLTSRLPAGASKEEVLDQTISWLSSNLTSASGKLPAIALQGIWQNSTDLTAQLSQQAMMATLQALNVEPFDNIDNADDISLPRCPYDPVHALTLAGYSFRAYLEPPSSSYRETFAAPVDGSKLSGLDQQLVYTDFVYPTTDIFARRAKGAVMIQVLESDGLEGEYVVIEMNGALALDLLNKKHCSMLCQRDPPSSRFRSIGDAAQDELVVNLFPSEKAYLEGSPPSDLAFYSLADLINQGMEKARYVDGSDCKLKFQRVSEEEMDKDFFHFSLLPTEMKLPFPFQNIAKDPQDLDAESVGSASITLHTSFIPFPDSYEGSETEEVSLLLANAEATSFHNLRNSQEDLSISTVLRTKLSPGQLPNPADWRRLAGAVRSLIDQDDIDLGITRTATLKEDLPGVLFIESLATDTEVWIFQDDKKKDIVVSFRGTEQVSWKDFLTDAQMFLQLWVPGEDIDLNVDITRTVGLADFIPGMLPTQQTSVAKDASAVHYGFLRAYLSVRDALIRGLKMISEEFSNEYSFHFTGHSLGGALGIIASADLQARGVLNKCEVSCMSYGSPKVGNVHFAMKYNELVPNSFRIVNDSDLVARMPRSLSTKAPVNRYQHAGRTVLINDEGDYWIEGYNAKTIIMANMSSVEDPFREKYKNLQDLFDFEQKLWNELISGRSVKHHMEDAYFTAMNKVVRKFLRANRA